MSETKASYAATSVPSATSDDFALFRALVKHHREARRWSQERLALEAEADHSLVSRLESGQRRPTRENAGKLAAGLELSAAQAETLMLAAGFVPSGLAVGGEGATLGLAVWRALSGEALPPVEREQLASIIRLALALALRRPADAGAPPPVPPPADGRVVPLRQVK